MMDVPFFLPGAAEIVKFDHNKIDYGWENMYNLF